MGLFVCEKCKCVENTALGLWWSRNADYWPEDVKGKGLCSECMPETHDDGSLTSNGGGWHGEFPKRTATAKDAKRVLNPWMIPDG
jgi:hypothetical protein